MNAIRRPEADEDFEPLFLAAPHRLRSAIHGRTPRFWIETQIALPEEDRYVEFVFEHREVAMIGVYRRGYFETPHGICYGPAAISEWRYLD